MCLVRSNIECGPKYAVKDIICYKVLYKSDSYHKYLSPCLNFTYELNKRVSSNFSFMNHKSYYFSPQREYLYLKYSKSFDCIQQGLHSFECLSAAITYKDCFTIKGGIVMECTIPKGSWYYGGMGHELVSDNIIINKELVI